MGVDVTLQVPPFTERRGDYSFPRGEGSVDGGLELLQRGGAGTDCDD